MEISKLLYMAEHAKTIIEPLPVMVDTSDPGSGKSYTVAVFLKDIGVDSFRAETTRVVILTQSPKSFDHKNFDRFLVVEGRRPDELDPETKEIINEANCLYAEEANILVSKGHDANILCKRMCGGFNDCKFKRVRFYSTIAKGIISTAASLQIMSGDILFVDEGTQNIPLTITINIPKRDFICMFSFIEKLDLTTLNERSQRKIKDLINILKLVIECLNKVELDPLPKNDEDSRELLADVFEAFQSSSLSKNVINAIKRSFVDEELLEKVSTSKDVPRNFLEHLFDFLSGKNYGVSLNAIQNRSAEMNLQVINPIWVDIVKSVKNMTIGMLVILDATPDEMLFEYLRSQGVDYIVKDFSLKKSKTSIKQVTNHMLSRSYGNLTPQIKGLIKKLAKEREGSIGIIWFRNKLDELQDFLREEGLDKRFVLGYWGYHNRGTNVFVECNTLVLIGRYIFSPIQAEMILKALGYNLSEQALSDTGELLIYPKTNKAIFRKHFSKLLRNFFLRETTQGIGRINRKGANEASAFSQQPEVYLLTNEPLDFEVDEIIRYEEILDFEDSISEKEHERRTSLKLTEKEIIERCEKAYNELITNGEKPTRDKIRERAGISNTVATRYLRAKKPAK